ncbi:basic proline-rich protein-like [Prinia subflava]|uniref:basic proline-rich protein-like n=1 Tax=Prinia subflava TaxID=208062 RepID=UPI002FE28206
MLVGCGVPRAEPKSVGRGLPWRATAQHLQQSTRSFQKGAVTPGAAPAVTPGAMEGPRLAGHAHAAAGSPPAARCAPATGHLMVAFKKREGPEGRPVPSRAPGGAGHGPCRDTAATTRAPAGSERDRPAARAARRGGSAPPRWGVCHGTGARAGALPAGPGVTATCGAATQPVSRVPGGGSGAPRGRPRARPPPPGRPGRAAAAPAPPAGISTRQPAGRAGTSSPRGTRPHQTASGTPTAEPLLAPAPRGRSVPPAGAPAAGAALRPAMLPEPGTNFPRRAPPGAASSPRSCPAPGAPSAGTHPRARRREAAALPPAQPGSSPHPVPRQSPAALRWRTHNFPCEPPPSALPFSSPSSPPLAARPSRGPSLGPSAPFVGRASAAAQALARLRAQPAGGTIPPEVGIALPAPSRVGQGHLGRLDTSGHSIPQRMRNYTGFHVVKSTPTGRHAAFEGLGAGKRENKPTQKTPPNLNGKQESNKVTIRGRQSYRCLLPLPEAPPPRL